jgi:hypothetical protein
LSTAAAESGLPPFESVLWQAPLSAECLNGQISGPKIIN